MTTPDPYSGLDPAPAATDRREQDRAYADPRTGSDTGVGDAPASDTYAADAHAADARATDTRAAPADGPGGTGTGDHEPLVTQQRSAEYSARWDQVKGGFVDEPRQAVAAADELVNELLEELQELFRGQRRNIEQSLDSSETSTEDLRTALRRYRSFFDRLLSI